MKKNLHTTLIWSILVIFSATQLFFPLTALAASSIEQKIQEQKIQQQQVQEQQVQLQQQAPAPGTELFGYDFFLKPYVSRDMALMSPDYILAPGDNLEITLVGSINNAIYALIDNDGYVTFPQVGKVQIGGKSVAEAQKILKNRFSQYFSDFDIRLNLDSSNQIRVFLTGEVTQPGVYNVSAMATLIDALLAVKGPSINGSMRNIKVFRNNKLITTFDLYDLLLKGDKTKDIRLQSDDVIQIPPKTATVSIMGDVKHPAVYELKGGETLKDIIDMAGGVPKDFNYSLQIAHNEGKIREQYLLNADTNKLYDSDKEVKDLTFRDKDKINITTLYATLPKDPSSVIISGLVKKPGEYKLTPNMTVADLVRTAGGIDDSISDPDKGEIIRKNIKQETVEIIPFNLNASIANTTENASSSEPEKEEKNSKNKKEDKSIKNANSSASLSGIILQKYDEVKIYPKENIYAGTVQVVGSVKAPGTYTIKEGEKLSSVVGRAGWGTTKAYLKGTIFIRESVKNLEAIQNKRFTQLQLSNLLNQTSYIQNSADALAVQQAFQSQRELITLLGQKQISGAIIMDLEKATNNPETDLILEPGDMIIVPQNPSTVYILGEVYNPGSMIFNPKFKLDDYLDVVGGTNPSADRGQIHIIRANGEVVKKDISGAKIEPGDTIVVPTDMAPKVSSYKMWMDGLDTAFKFVTVLATLKVLGVIK